MRRFFTGLVVTAIASLVSTFALAGNQDTADQIAKNMRSGGQLRDYSVEVKCQDGTAWLNGRVRDEQQMAVALKTALATPGVERVVNGLTTSAAEASLVVRTSADARQRLETRVLPAGWPAPSRTRLRARRLRLRPEPLPMQTVVQQQPIARTGSAPMARIEQRQRSHAAAMPPRQWSTNYRKSPGRQALPVRRCPCIRHPRPAECSPVNCDQPALPNYAWPIYAAYPNYASVTYPRQYSPTAWPYIGPFYPYPQVPLGMAPSDLAMGRRLVVPGLQGQAELLGIAHRPVVLIATDSCMATIIT